MRDSGFGRRRSPGLVAAGAGGTLNFQRPARVRRRFPCSVSGRTHRRWISQHPRRLRNEHPEPMPQLAATPRPTRANSPYRLAYYWVAQMCTYRAQESSSMTAGSAMKGAPPPARCRQVQTCGIAAKTWGCDRFKAGQSRFCCTVPPGGGVHANPPTSGACLRVWEPGVRPHWSCPGFVDGDASSGRNGRS